MASMSRSRRWLILTSVVVFVVLVVPRWTAGVGAGAYFDGELAAQDALAQTVVKGVMEQEGPTAYQTGFVRFDGQSTIAIHQMALLGLGQIVLDHPEKREAYLPAMRAAADHLADPSVLVYADQVYAAEGDRAYDEGRAYLGYTNLGLGMLRMIDPDGPHAPLHDRITADLTRRIAASKHGMIETYPGETWPPDVAAVVGSIGLHARATKTDRSELLARWAETFERCALHGKTGLLFQRMTSGSCEAVDAPRGSGTAIASYFLSFATPVLARRLYDALVAELWVDVLGFGGVREYASGFTGEGDVNAGPILFGVSVGATGFAIAATRTHGDRARFRGLYRSTSLFGVPTSVDGRTAFAAGGVLGNALLLAMLTARPLR
ncbi:MAG: hypothetical protein KIT84_19985 [Labilithrix sp.]|nr:hypothetical protein [Labilithrix sp.]MCW5813319.1 hypothetical protein [Labilithrix sp.]